MGKAPPPPAEWAGFREDNRAARAAVPSEQLPAVFVAPTRAFLVVGHRLVGGVERGGIVELAATPATGALIEAGHIVPA